MYSISKEFHFSASHVLNGLPDGHPCGRLHGHNYIVIVELTAEQLDSVGFVVDFGELNALKLYLDQTFDHRHLNDVFDENPTAEHLAQHLYRWCKDHWQQTSAVKVSETSKTWAVYREISG